MPKVRNDRFGRPSMLVGCSDKKGNGFAKGYVKLGGKDYLIEPSEAQKEGVDFWVKITALPKRSRPSM